MSYRYRLNGFIAGYIHGVGEGGDHMRWSIQHDRAVPRVVEEQAKLIWPDGTIVEVVV